MSKDRKNQASVNLGDYLTVSEAASFLGVSSGTLRNWDREGKLIAIRHPLNGYRLYEKGSLERLLAGVTKASKRSERHG